MAQTQRWVEEHRETVYEIDAEGKLGKSGSTIVLCCPHKHRFRVHASAGVAKLTPTLRVRCSKCAETYAKPVYGRPLPPA